MVYYLGNSWDGTQLSKAVVLRFLNSVRISKKNFFLLKLKLASHFI